MVKKKEPEKESSIETFLDPRGYWINQLKKSEPSCFNGNVAVFKWRVIVEKVDEPADIICARLEKLWTESDNWHHLGPLEKVAKENGYTFKGGFGSLKEKANK